MDLLNIDNRLLAIERVLVANKRSLTFEEGCRYTGFSESYIYKLTSAGVIPFSKPHGKNIFFDRYKLDEWLLSNTPNQPVRKNCRPTRTSPQKNSNQ